MKRGRPREKYGKRILVYLSNESILKAKKLDANFSTLVEKLILEKWKEKNGE